MNDADFFKAIDAEPENNLHWEVYADWLEEQGDPAAAHIRHALKRRAMQEELDRRHRELLVLGDEINQGSTKPWSESWHPRESERSRKPEYKYTHDDGRAFDFEHLHQRLTYREPGAPPRDCEHSQRIVDDCLTAAGRWLHPGKQACLVPPGLLALTGDLEDSAEVPLVLPPVVCRATLHSSTVVEPLPDWGADFSQVVVIWFQHHFCGPIDPFVLAHMQGIDWDHYGMNGDCFHV